MTEMTYDRMAIIYNQDIDNLPHDADEEDTSEVQMSYIKTMVEWLNYEGAIDDNMAQQIISNAINA